MHACVWRICVCMVVSLLQTADSARQLLALYDPKLGVPIPELSYAEDCTIYTPNNPNGTFYNVEVYCMICCICTYMYIIDPADKI